MLYCQPKVFFATFFKLKKNAEYSEFLNTGVI